MSVINCMIIDDEPLARDIIQTYLQKLPGWQLTASCINAVEAYESMLRSAIDVMFLDIQMPGISGIEFLRSLKQPPLVVFTTAYAHHAVTGFELNAVDYLVKPITFHRFCQAAEKITERLFSKTVKEIQPMAPVDYFFIKQESRLVKINYSDILFMEAQRDFTFIYLSGKKLLASMHLKALEAILLPAHIMRVHRSYIVNLNAIKSITGNVLEIDGREIPIGANYKEALFKSLGL